MFNGHLGRVKTLWRNQSRSSGRGWGAPSGNTYGRVTYVRIWRENGPSYVPQFRNLHFELFKKKKNTIDFVGKIYPPTARVLRYILSIVDLCSHWVEALPLKCITAEDIVVDLLSVFCRMGFPDVILSDKGNPLRFEDHEEVSLTCSPLHKQLARAITQNWTALHKHSMFEINAGQNYNRIPTEWDGYLPAELFAYVEVPQKSIGFSSHGLFPGQVFGYPFHSGEICGFFLIYLNTRHTKPTWLRLNNA